MRIAAVGDVHLGTDSRGMLRPALRGLPDHADVLLLAGDLTNHGTLPEAEVVATDFADVAATLQTGRRQFPYRRALVASGREEAVSLLKEPSDRRTWMDYGGGPDNASGRVCASSP